MSVVQKTPDNFNPIDRDLVIVLTTGFVVAITIVLVGIVLLNQIF